jgi:hypothetical protein
LDPSNLVNEPEIFALESSPETEIDHELRLRLR